MNTQDRTGNSSTGTGAFNSGVINSGTLNLGGPAGGGSGGNGGSGWRELVPLVLAFCAVVLTAAGLYLAVLVAMRR